MSSTINASKPKPRLTWKADKTKRHHPKTHSFGSSDCRLARVQQLQDGRWFWYGGGKNTNDSPTSLEQAKADAKAHILSVMRSDTTQPPKPSHKPS